MVADAQFYRGRNLDIVQQAETIGAYATAIVHDYERYVAATAICETADRLGESEATSDQYLLLIGALRALADPRFPARGVLDSYLLRTMTLSGWAPRLDSCAKCGSTEQLQAFVPALGGVVCRSCAPAGSRILYPQTLLLLQQLLGGEWENISQHDEQTVQDASALIANYVSWYLERGLKSLQYLSPQFQNKKGPN